MFVLNDKVVYPGHGVAKISRIIEKKVMGIETKFFELEFINKEMTILVPVNSITTVGIRKLSSHDNISAIFKMLAEPVSKLHCELNVSNWNKRNKEYQCKIRTGNISEIGKIYRDLRHISTYKELSFGEKNLLHQTEGLLIEEISLVTHMPTEQAIEHVRALCKNSEALVPLMPHMSPQVISAP